VVRIAGHCVAVLPARGRRPRRSGKRQKFESVARRWTDGMDPIRRRCGESPLGFADAYDVMLQQG